MEPKYVVVFVWFAWLVSWMAAASWTKNTVKAPARGSERVYRFLQFVGFAMLFASLGHDKNDAPVPSFGTKVIWFLFTPLWEPSAIAEWFAVLLAVAGFAFAWWARMHIGELWSSSVTRKDGHTVIDSGPYAIVRHPIYTGMLLGTVALVLVSGRLIAVIGLVTVVVGLWLKARLEERFLSAELGADAYASYAKRVPMLVPGLPG